MESCISFNLVELDITEEWNWKNKLAAWFPQEAALALQKRETRKIANDSFVNNDFFDHVNRTDFIRKPVVRTYKISI